MELLYDALIKNEMFIIIIYVPCLVILFFRMIRKLIVQIDQQTNEQIFNIQFNCIKKEECLF